MKKREFIFSIMLIALSLMMLFFLHGNLTGLSILQQSNETQFNEGFYNNTFYSKGGIILSAGNISGDYASEIFGSEDNLTFWSNFSWNSSVFGELNNNQEGKLMKNNILLFHLEDNSTFVHDSSGNNNSGSFEGIMDLEQGKIGNAFNFSGAENIHIERENNSLIDSKTISFSAWVKNTARDNNYQTYILCRAGGSSGCSYGLYFNDGLSNDKVGVEIVTKSGGKQRREWSWNNMDENWSHFAVTYSKNKNGTIKLFHNGALVKKWHNLGKPLKYRTQYANDDLFIGSKDNAGYFKGRIDEVSIWNVSLSKKKIKEIYEMGANKLNLQVRFCDNINCTNSSWRDFGTSNYQVLNYTSKFFQYNFDFFGSEDSSPKLYSVLLDSVFINSSETKEDTDKENSEDLPSYSGGGGQSYYGCFEWTKWGLCNESGFQSRNCSDRKFLSKFEGGVPLDELDKGQIRKCVYYKVVEVFNEEKNDSLDIENTSEVVNSELDKQEESSVTGLAVLNNLGKKENLIGISLILLFLIAFGIILFVRTKRK